MKTVSLGDIVVGHRKPPYVIAEIGSNHNGDMDLCRRLIDAAADVGADAVKFQSWSESSLIARKNTIVIPTTRTRRSTSARSGRW